MNSLHTSSVLRSLLISTLLACAALSPLSASAQYNLFAWGDSTYGQNQAEATQFRSAPKLIPALSNTVAIAAGNGTSFALRNDGSLSSWGSNLDGNLGTNSTLSATPDRHQVMGLGPVKAVSEGQNFTLVLQQDGTVWAWGYNNNGQLGNDTTINQYSPFQTLILTNVTAISAGGGSSYALKSDGTVWSWGVNNIGQLGDGTTTERHSPVQVKLPNKKFVAVSAGTSFAIALADDGTVWAWGYNSNGELGNGTNKYQSFFSTPAPVVSLTGVTAISAGGDFSLALLNDGSIWGWGYNGGNQLIPGRATTLNIPNEIPVPNPVVSIYAGTNSSFAIQSDGTVWGWGYNGDGGLGNGTMTSPTGPIQLGFKAKAFAISKYWRTVFNTNFNDTDDAHTLMLDQNNKVWSWQYNFSGELGVGCPGFPPPNGALGSFRGVYPASSVSLGLRSITAVSAGGSYVLALLRDGSLLSWGYNLDGELGNNSAISSLIPVSVSNSTGLTHATAVSASSAFSLGINNDGSVYAWGSNASGQLGDGTTASHQLPTKVKNLTGVVGIGTGARHSLAIKSDGTVWAWGYNADGELGNNTRVNSSLPVQPIGISGAVAVAGGLYHSLALTSDGSVWAWGDNSNGQLGVGGSHITPTKITTVSNIVAIAAGGSSSMALDANGNVYTWGLNSSGQLGNNSTSNSSTPIKVMFPFGASAITSIAMGSNFAFAISSTGQMYAWGANDKGQINDGSLTERHSPVLSSIQGAASVTAGSNFAIALKTDPDPDTNRDGSHDLLWYNSTTGDLTSWFMNGPSYSGSYAFLYSGVPMQWTPVGTADLNRDGKTDLLWQNAVTGDVTYWLLNGTQLIASDYIARSIPLEWKIASVADFNGDGKPDLVWQNTATGDVTVWYMDGVTWTGAYDYLAHGVPTQWQIVGTADFNGDGNADLIWRNTATGDVTVWYMNGATYTADWDYLAQNVPLNWKPVSAQNLQSDGKTNLIWKNTAGDTVLWFMDGPTLLSYQFLLSGLPGWTVIRAH